MLRQLCDRSMFRDVQKQHLGAAGTKAKTIPIVSMYGIFSYIYHKNQPNVGIYTIHGSYGIVNPGGFVERSCWGASCW